MGSYDHLTNDELFAIAQFELSQEDLSNAFTKLKLLITRDDCPIFVHGAIARCYARLQLFPQAEQHFKRFIEDAPNALVEKFQLGLTILDQNRQDEALEIWDEVLKEAPNFPPILYHKALVNARNGETEQAKNLLKELFAHTPTDNFYFNKGKELSDALQNTGSAPASLEPGDASELAGDAYQDSNVTKH